jgi:hypothetical protein
MKKMVGYRFQHGFGRLRARCVVEEYEVILQCRKRGSNLIYREL